MHGSTQRCPPSCRRLALLAAAVAVLLLALGTRMLAVGELNPDFDEDDYLRAGQLYATGLQAGDPGVFLRENYRPEHPPLSKIVTGLAIAPLAPAPEIPDVPITAGPNNDLPEPHLTVARTAGAVFGALTAFLLALVSPLGGLWLALHTWSIKYSSQVMLEAVPAFFALLAVLLSTRAWRPGVVGRRRAAWLAAAAIAFGLACAGKYLYGVAGLAIAVDWALRVRSTEEGAGPRLRGLVPILGFLALGAVAFLAANPYLWPDPVGRLISSITYHGGYVGTDAVQETGWPIWQPLVWLMGSVPAGWQEESTFVVAVDVLITALAVTGLRRLWGEQRVYALWLLLAFVFLLAWPSKWPQYILVLSAPLCLAAGLGTENLLRPAWVRLRAAIRRDAAQTPAPTGERTRTRGRPLRDLRTALPWLAPGIIALLLLGIGPLVYEGLLSTTDMQLSSLKDGLNGGVMRESVGGLTGQIPATSFEVDARSKEVSYVGADLLSSMQQGVWLGFNSTADLRGLLGHVDAPRGRAPGGLRHRRGTGDGATGDALHLRLADPVHPPLGDPRGRGGHRLAGHLPSPAGPGRPAPGRRLPIPGIPGDLAGRAPVRGHMDGVAALDAGRHGRPAHDPPLGNGGGGAGRR